MRMKSIPASHQALLSDDLPAFAFLSTLMADGTPQCTPVWFNMQGEHFLVNSEEGRVKDRNMRARPRVALTIADPDNWYRYMQVRGTVVEVTTQGARDHIDALSKKYTGQEVYARHTENPRVTYRIKPERISVQG
jgi:PPOX class probable F420-dependent enzyme